MCNGELPRSSLSSEFAPRSPVHVLGQMAHALRRPPAGCAWPPIKRSAPSTRKTERPLATRTIAKGRMGTLSECWTSLPPCLAPAGGSRTIRRTIPPPARPGQANSGACPAGRRGWEVLYSARGRFHLWAVTQARELRAYYAARNNGYTVPRAAPFAGKALALAPDVTQGLGPPHGPYREGRAAAPRRALPRTVRSRLACRLFYAPHSKWTPKRVAVTAVFKIRNR